MSTTVAYLVMAAAYVASAWAVWRFVCGMAADNEALQDENDGLHDRLDEVVAWLWAREGLDMPEPETQHLPAWEPPASSLVDRYQHRGAHRAWDDDEGPATRGPIVESSGSRVGGSGEAARPPTDEGEA